MATFTVGSVVINVVDIDRAQEFWSAVLGVAPARSIPGFFVWLQPQHPGGVSVALQKAFDPKTSRNRVHLDIGVDDLDAAQTRIEELGGSLVETHNMGDFTWRVMGDPEGNEFCIADRNH